MELMLTFPLGFFPSRSAVKAWPLCLTLHREGVLCVSGGGRSRRYPTVNGTVTLPPSALAEGENRLLFRSDTCRIPCESLRREGNTVTPAGFDPLPLLCTLPGRITALEKAVAALGEDVRTLQGKVNGFSLFEEEAYEMHKM